MALKFKEAKEAKDLFEKLAKAFHSLIMEIYFDFATFEDINKMKELYEFLYAEYLNMDMLLHPDGPTLDFPLQTADKYFK